MKKTIAIAAAALLLTASLVCGASPRKKAAASNTVVYKTSIECQNCAKKVIENISFERGVVDLKVDVPTQTVEIVFDPARTDTLRLKLAIGKLGYTAEIIEYK